MRGPLTRVVRRLRRDRSPDLRHLYDAEYYRSAAAASGYGDYRRENSHADALATMLTTWLPFRRSLDVGAAAGFLVEALRDRGVDATGTDLSAAARDLAAPTVRPHLEVADLTAGLPRADDAVELVTCFETLEHLAPDEVPAAIAELARVSSAYVVASMPSFGPNPSGPDGWFDGKVRPERLGEYRDRVGFDGPVPFADLAVDADGTPVEGHLTIASYAWWRDRFAEAGLVPCPATELRCHLDLARYGLREYVCLYVLRHRHVDEPTAPVRSAEAVAEDEARWALLDHGAPAVHVEQAQDDARAAGLSTRPT